MCCRIGVRKGLVTKTHHTPEVKISARTFVSTGYILSDISNNDLTLVEIFTAALYIFWLGHLSGFCTGQLQKSVQKCQMCTTYFLL